MANLKPKRFMMNSLFPMPAQTDKKTVTVEIPAGTSNGGASYANIITKDVTLPAETGYLRVNITASRNGMTYPGTSLVQYAQDGTFITFIRAMGNGKFRCTVMITVGLDESYWTTQSACNYTFNIVGFRVP